MESNTLTPREQEIAAAVARALLTKEIAAQLGVTEQTVKNHIGHIYRKLGARNRAEFILLYVRRAA